MRRTWATSLCLSVLVQGVIGAYGATDAVAEPPADGAVAAAAAANNRLGLELLQKLSKKQKNVFISPLSLSAVMPVLLEGSAGATRAQFLTALAVDEADREELQTQIRLLCSQIVVDRETPELRMGTSIWIRRGAALTPRMAAFAEECNVFQKSVEFGDPATVAEINQWSSEATAGQITDLVAQGGVNRLTEWLIANVLYFKAAWTLPFPEDASECDFHVSGQRRSTAVPAMQQIAKFRLVQNLEGFDALELRYVGEEFVAVCLLPLEENAELWKRAFSQPALKELQQKLAEAEESDVDVCLPLFHVRSKSDLRTAFQAMGVRQAFAPKADFRGLAEQNRFPITEFVQDIDLSVTPKGTEASARTKVGASGSVQKKIPEFHVNRPFLFFIVHRASGAVLFAGKVDDPR